MNTKMKLPNTVLDNPNNGIETPNYPITNLDKFKEYFVQVTNNQLPPSTKMFCVMLFYNEADITGNYNDNVYNWINTKNVYFRNGTQALAFYADTPCPASQIIDAESYESLMEQRNKMLLNFKDKKFLDQLYKTI